MKQEEWEVLTEVLERLKHDVSLVKKRRKYSRKLEQETRRAIGQLHIIRERAFELSTFKMTEFPDQLGQDWYDNNAFEYFELGDDDNSDYEDYTQDQIEEFETTLYSEIKDVLNQCDTIVSNALYELKKFIRPREQQINSEIPNEYLELQEMAINGVLIFPISTEFLTITKFLEIMYPERNVEIQTTEDQIFFLVHDLVQNSVVLKFEMAKEDYWVKLYCLKNPYRGTDFDHWKILVSQFQGKFIFDILEYIHKKYYDIYFKAIHALITEDMRTAGLNFGYIADHFGKVVLSDLIPNSIGKNKDMKQVWEFLQKHDDWADWINSLQKIQKLKRLSKQKKKLLISLFHGFHYARVLRNRALHPDETFHSMISPTLLIILISLQIDVRQFLSSWNE